MQQCMSWAMLVIGSYPEIDHSLFKTCDWSEFFRDAKEAIPMNASEPQGKEVNICMFVDYDYAGDKVSQINKWFFDICEHHISAVVLKETGYRRDISFWC